MIAPARRVAYRILCRVATTEAHSDDLLRSPEVDALSAVDRNLTTTLVLGTLRWQLALDAQIRPWLARPDRQLSPEAATALRLGAYQLFHLARVPPHAVLNDSVELVKQSQERGAAGMVNAVLRKLQRRAAGVQRPATAATPRSAAELAGAFAHPAWMVGRWVRRYGLAAAEAICRWDQEPAAVTLRAAGAETDPEVLETEPGFFLAGARRVVRGDASRTAPFREGRVHIQDEASQLVAEIAAAAAPDAGRILDTCAAPGGKTAILAERFPEAEVTALDISQKRLAAMAQTSQAGRFAPPRRHPIQFQAADAASVQLRPEWELILCDVPCSGTGTLARNPEIRLRVSEADLQRQQARQLAILGAGLRGLKPGGRLVYSTCSLEPEENEAVVEAVLASVPGGRVVAVGGLLDRLAEEGIVTAEGRDRLRRATEGDFLRTIPGVHPCDGFFAAILEKRPH